MCCCFAVSCNILASWKGLGEQEVMHRSGLDLVLLNIIITDLEEGISGALIKYEEDLKRRSCQQQN